MTYRQLQGVDATARGYTFDTFNNAVNHQFGWSNASKTTGYSIKDTTNGIDIKHPGVIFDTGINNYFADGQTTITNPFVTTPELFTPDPTFIDSFQGQSSIDPTKWIQTYSNNRRSTSGEYEWYTTDTDAGYSNADFGGTGGNLRLIAKKEDITGTSSLVPGSGTPVTYHWTSGILTTYGLFSQFYGYFEAKLKFPPGQGMFPAFWLYRPSSATGTQELDIVENLGADPLVIYNTNWGGHTGLSAQGRRYLASADDPTANFHTYGVSWRPDVIKYYCDGIETARTFTEIPDTALNIMLNLAVGGWKGGPDGTTPTTNYLECEYVKAYQYLDLQALGY